jgi:mRNA-degrading endonuclease RelE of RelBE toxin-antitoxin system
MIRLANRGNFNKTMSFFRGTKTLSQKWKSIFEKYGEKGLKILKRYTPKDTGDTANKWSYRITKRAIIFENSNVNKGIPIVVLIQYGHATRNGGYVPPNDFINANIKPIFDKIAQDCWKEVTSL